MQVNEKLLKRICALVAMSYALSPTRVWEIYKTNNSLDKTLEIITQINE